MLSNSKLNNDNSGMMLSGYSKLDNGRIENILQVMQQHTAKQSDNTMIGLQESNNYLEKLYDTNKELTDAIKSILEDKK
jgi:hypothetical protein